MRSLFAALSLTTLALAATPVLAQDAAATSTAPVRAREGAQLLSADGHRMGRIVHVTDRAVSITVGSRFVFVPIATLTDGNSARVTTSLTRDQIRALR